MNKGKTKRVLDIIISLMMLFSLFPFIIMLTIVVRIFIGTPVFFTQKRPGIHGAPFKLYKIRTMSDIRDSLGRLLPDTERLTPFGRFLRSASLDELPELFNVLKGDMSLVGPRPLLMQYLDYYSPEQARRHEVKPGITGWAQVNGRNSISWTKKFALDTWYTDHQSFLLDLKILFLTAKKIFKTSEINTSTNETMPAFNGNN